MVLATIYLYFHTSKHIPTKYNTLAPTLLCHILEILLLVSLPQRTAYIHIDSSQGPERIYLICILCTLFAYLILTEVNIALYRVI